MIHDHKEYGHKEQGGCCGGMKSDQGVQKKTHDNECHDPKDKKTKKTESGAQDGCCGGSKK
jgi:hypothetical protein